LAPHGGREPVRSRSDKGLACSRCSEGSGDGVRGEGTIRCRAAGAVTRGVGEELALRLWVERGETRSSVYERKGWRPNL
jgi:hypothetical protein